MKLCASDLTEEVLERFHSKYKRMESGCWEWQVSLRAGYGAFKIKGVIESAHRVMYLITHGNLPEGKIVCHLCDNRKCVNPEHLFLGTYQDNAKDAAKKGRMYIPDSRGEKQGRSKLTELQVKEILILCKSVDNNAELGRIYGVHKETIRKIRRRLKWKHIEDEGMA